MRFQFPVVRIHDFPLFLFNGRKCSNCFLASENLIVTYVNSYMYKYEVELEHVRILVKLVEIPFTVVKNCSSQQIKMGKAMNSHK